MRTDLRLRLLLQLRYGKDQAMYCGLEIDAALFSWMQAAVSAQGACGAAEQLFVVIAGVRAPHLHTW